MEGDEIRNWLIFDERGRLQKNEDELRQYVAEYVAKLAATHDTVNTEREFCTTSGRTVQVYSSVYGWKIDQEKEIETIMQEMIAGVQINREPVYACLLYTSRFAFRIHFSSSCHKKILLN